MFSSTETYSISQLSNEFEITPRALRFYEDKGLLAPRRDGLSRIYSARERGRLKLILYWKRLGFPLSDIKEMIDLHQVKDGGRTQMAIALKKYLQRQQELSAQVEEVASALRDTEQGIAWLQEHLPANATEDAR